VTLVLDTNVVRGIGADEIDPSGFRSLKDRGVQIHIADGTIAESTHQLLNTMPWDHWVRARTAWTIVIAANSPQEFACISIDIPEIQKCVALRRPQVNHQAYDDLSNTWATGFEEFRRKFDEHNEQLTQQGSVWFRESTANMDGSCSQKNQPEAARDGSLGLNTTRRVSPGRRIGSFAAPATQEPVQRQEAQERSCRS